MGEQTDDQQDDLPQVADEEDETTQDIAYSYGCPWFADLDGELFGQLRLANQLWNRLVEIHYDHEARKAAIWLTHPVVAAFQQQLDDAGEQVAAAVERIRRSRQEDRTTAPREQDKAALEAARAAVRAAKAARDEARDEALPGLADVFAEAKKNRIAAVKATYPEFTAKGLGWGTVNDVTRRRFAKAAGKVEEHRASGKAARLRFHRFDGTGTLTVQVMGGAAVPPRLLPALNSGKHPRSGVLQLAPWRDPAGGRPGDRARHGTLQMTIGRTRELGPLPVTIPVVLDRCLPPDAEIREVKVTRFRLGTRFRVRVALVCRIPAPPPRLGDHEVAVRLSWQAAGNGWVTVANVASSGPLPPVPGIPDRIIRVAGDSRHAQIMCSPVWRRLLDRDAGIQSVRDQNLDILRDKLTVGFRDDPGLATAVTAAYRDEHVTRRTAAIGVYEAEQEAEQINITAADIARWRAPWRFAKLASFIEPEPAAWAAAEQQWKTTHPIPDRGKGWRQRMIRDVSAQFGGARKPGRQTRFPASHPLASILQEWRDRDRHLLDFQANETAQVLARRRDAYRVTAAWLCKAATSIILDGADLAIPKQVPAVDKEDPEPARGSRRLMHTAAPGELRAAIRAAADRRSIPVTEVKAKKPSGKQARVKGEATS